VTLLPSTIALLLCLLVATLLGAGIGACLWHLRLARRHDSAVQRLSRSGEREREALATMLSQQRAELVARALVCHYKVQDPLSPGVSRSPAPPAALPYQPDPSRPSHRTNRTRLVPPTVLSGHVSSLPPY